MPIRPALLLLTVLALTLGVAGCDVAPNSTPTNSATPTESSKSSTEKTEALAQHDVENATEIVEAPETGVALGWGWNRGDSEPIPTICVEFVPGEEPAQNRYMTMREVNDSYELMQSMGMSAEASVKTIGFEASGKAQFAKSQNITSSRSTFVLNAVVENGVRYAAPAPEAGSSETFQPLVGPRGGSSGAIRLTEEALKLARQSNMAAFKRRCGSDFVSAIYGGAKLTGVVSFSSSSKTEKSKFSSQMSGSGWGARFKGTINNNSTSGESSERMDVSIFMTGGQGDAIPATVDDLKGKLQTISLDAYTAPKDFHIAITPYEILSNWPGKALPDRQDEFEELASYWGAYNTLYDEFQRVLDTPVDYMAPTLEGKLLCARDICADKRLALQTAEKSYRKALSAVKPFNAEGIIAYDKASKDLETAQASLRNCVNQELNTSLERNPVDLDLIRRAQDEVLISLKRMENEARECVDKSDTCLFDARNYRSPYAFRIQLPLPLDAGVTNLDELLSYRLGQIAKSRCAQSSNNPGCLSNADIQAWGRKVGLESVNKAVRPDMFKQQLAIMQQMASLEAADTEVQDCLTPRFEREPGRQNVLWFNPRAAAPTIGSPPTPTAQTAESS